MKKQPAKKTKENGLVVLSEVTLSKAEQIKLATKKEARKTFTYHMQVAQVIELTLSQSEDECDNDDGDNDDDDESDDHDDASDDERIESDSKEIPDPNLTNVDQTEYEEEDVDEGVWSPSNDEFTNEEKLDDEETMDDEEDEEVLKELYEDVNVNLEKGFEQEEEDAHLTLTLFSDAQKADEPVQSSSVSFDFTSKFLNLVSALEYELSELKQTNQFAKDVSLILGIVDKYLASKMKEAVNVVVQLQTNKLREEAQAKNQDFLNQVDSTVNKIIKDQVKEQVSKMMSKIEKGRDDQDKDEDPSTGSDRGTKRRKSGKDAETSKDSSFKEKKSSSTSKDASKSQHKSFGKSVHGEEPSHTVEESAMQQDQEKPLPLIQDHRGRQVIPKDYFINKDLEYLKGEDSSRRYSTYVTKTTAATYELKWIKDLVPELWSPVVVKFNKHSYFGTSHWVPNAKPSTDMQVEDLQLGVKRYQKKLNHTKPDTYRSNLMNKTAYTSHSNPHKIICVDQSKRKRLMHTDDLHKFSDRTLNDVRTVLHNIVAGLRMDYLPMRRWINLDKKRARVMLQDIEKQLYQRRLMRNLEKFVGGRPTDAGKDHMIYNMLFSSFRLDRID
nr:hypothetical protein [Tanacetum cinerariifolium]